MIIGLLNVLLFFSESHSLKEKRLLLKSIKTKIRNKFNVSVIELNSYEKWQRCSIAIACLANSKSQANTQLSLIINFLEHTNSQNIVDYSIELL